MNEIQAHTHTGVMGLFSLRFVKKGEVNEKWGKLLGRLFKYRQRGNYGDFKEAKSDVLPLVNEVEEFKSIVLNLLQQAGYKINNES